MLLTPAVANQSRPDVFEAPPVSPAPGPTGRYYPALDGVRALAAMMVIVFHSLQDGLPLPGFVSFGQSGVDLFFVLSGFLITSILLAAQPRSWSEVRTFYARRSLRIFPLYYLCLVVCTVLLFRCSWPYWIYLQNFWQTSGWSLSGPPHLWSLAVEEQFYLVWPFAVLFLPRTWLPRLLAIAMVVPLLLRAWLVLRHHDVYFLTFTRLDALAAGGVLALSHADGTLHACRNRLLIAALVAFALIIGMGLHFKASGNVVYVSTKYSLLALMYAGFLGWLMCSPQARLSRWLQLRPLRFLGRISYGLYVWHPLLLSYLFLHWAGVSPWLKAAVGYPLVLAVATLSFYGFERPFLRLKDRWAPGPRYAPEATLAP